MAECREALSNLVPHEPIPSGTMTLISPIVVWQRVREPSGPHLAVKPLRVGENPGEEGKFAVLRFIRHLLYLLGAVQGLGACPHKPTFQVRRLKVRCYASTGRRGGNQDAWQRCRERRPEICS